jgi:hypothetical protein
VRRLNPRQRRETRDRQLIGTPWGPNSLQLGGTPLRLFALSIQHAAVRRVPLVAKEVFDAAPDVVILSEFYLNMQGRRLVGLLEAAGLVHQVHGVAGSERYPYTVAIASRTRIVRARNPIAGTSHAHRVVEATIQGITVAGVSFPLAKQHDPFWDQHFLPYIGSLASRPAIVAGDWNTGSGELDIGGGPVAGHEPLRRPSRGGVEGCVALASPGRPTTQGCSSKSTAPGLYRPLHRPDGSARDALT